MVDTLIDISPVFLTIWLLLGGVLSAAGLLLGLVAVTSGLLQGVGVSQSVTVQH